MSKQIFIKFDELTENIWLDICLQFLVDLIYQATVWPYFPLILIASDSEFRKLRNINLETQTRPSTRTLIVKS